MYCVKCGVKLADTEKKCPLCGTRAIHPDIIREQGEELYPRRVYPDDKSKTMLWQTVAIALALTAMLITFVCDMQLGGGVTWSGYVIGALTVVYVMLVLPFWFKKRNPVIFVPVSFAAIGLYLLYINFVTKGDWFLSFAFPVVGGVAVIVTTVVVLFKYLKHGKLYVLGGAIIGFGAFMLLVEFLMVITFKSYSFIGWSYYPLVALGVLGGFLIFLAINRPARELMEQKFFF
ncbi:MAG: zinc ribbon domain-containing protein [Oscillospiraceae bacterium]|nr:zinc ribbon domain-containing protein [Oscillospiraceae bacterium]MBQ9939739.1 zinc ribbon domain-containing protein [Oscillospiraceae bacterium]